MTDLVLAQNAYAAYGAATGGKNYRGEPMPDWADLGEQIQAAWLAAVTAIAAPAEQTLTACYRERAHLVAFLTVLYPSTIVIDGDPNAPGWALVYVDSPTGQLSWHLSGDDLDLFPHVERVASNAVIWDGHTTDEKYARIRQLTADLAPFLLADTPRTTALPTARSAATPPNSPRTAAP